MDLDKLRQWALGNLIKFNKVMSKVLHLGWDSNINTGWGQTGLLREISRNLKEEVGIMKSTFKNISEIIALLRCSFCSA